MFSPQQILPLPEFHRHDGECGIAFVPGAARAAGGTGDALVEVNLQEHERRNKSGIHAVTDLGLLARLIRLPYNELVCWDDLSAEDQRRLRSVPDGIVDCNSAGVRRILTQPATVPLVLVRSRSWRQGLRRVSVFEPFAQRVLILHDFHSDVAQLAWQADVLGVGVWLQSDSDLREIVPSAPWQQKYVKAAGWRFRERAYHAWLTARPLQEWCASPKDHSALQADVALGPLRT